MVCTLLAFGRCGPAFLANVYWHLCNTRLMWDCWQARVRWTVALLVARNDTFKLNISYDRFRTWEWRRVLWSAKLKERDKESWACWSKSDNDIIISIIFFFKVAYLYNITLRYSGDFPSLMRYETPIVDIRVFARLLRMFFNLFFCWHSVFT